MNLYFGGQQIKRPGAYSIVDTANMVPVQVGAFNVLCFIGAPGTVTEPAKALPTDRVSYFNQPSLARIAIGSCDLMDAMDTAWRHGADLIAVSPVKGTGTSGAIVDADWQTAIDRLETEEVDCIIPVTTAAAIHTKVDTHVTAMSTIKSRKERRAIYGHTTGLSVDAIIALQAGYSSERAMLATPGVYMYNDAGEKVLRSSMFLASAYAGIWASQEPQEPITYKYVKFPSLEKAYTAVEIEQLLDGHIAVTESVRNKGFRIVQGVTTSSSADLTKNEWSVSVLKDVMSKNLRNHFEEKFVGKAGVKGIEITIYNDLITLLEKFIKNGWLTGYVPESVRVIKEATSFYLEYEGSPTLPINNILITSHFTL